MTYPFNEHRVQVGADRCPAPWCGVSLLRELPWFTAVMFAGDYYVSFAAAKLDPHATACYRLKTCRRSACIEWARLRAEDLRGGPRVDPLYVAHLWSTRPHPQPPEDMQRDRLERTLRDAIDRIQDRLRTRPVA